MRLGLEVEQLPTSDSYLFLDPEDDPRDAAIGVHWSLGGAEIEAVSTFCTELSDRFERAGLGRIALDERLTRKDPSFFDGFLDAYHHMGGVPNVAKCDYRRRRPRASRPWRGKPLGARRRSISIGQFREIRH